MPSAPHRPDPLLPLAARHQARQWTRWFHYSVMLSLVVGMLTFAPLPFRGTDGSLPWWPFGGEQEGPATEEVEVAVGDGTADMEVDWANGLPESEEDTGPGQVETPSFEAEPQVLDLESAGGAVPTGYVEGVSQELTEERTENSTVFANPDGTETLRVYQAPAFTADADGDLVPVDPDLERTGDGRWSPAAAADVSFAPVAGETDIIRFGAGEGQIQYGLDDAAPVAARVDGHQVTYAEVLPGTDLRYTVAGWGAKADLILADQHAGIEWTFPLALDAVSAEVDEASGSVLFLDAEGNAVAAVPAGFAEDSNVDPLTGEGARTYALDYRIVESGGAPALRVTLDADWFDDPDRVFPVTVDPTLSDANGLTSGDTYVQKPYTNNFSGEGEIKVGYVDGNTAAGLLKFDDAMDALDNKYIRGATLSLYNTYSYSCSARTVKVHRITESWSANSSMSWPGPAFDATAEVSRSFAHGYSSSCGDAWETFTLDREHVTQWAHGTESFYGFRIEASRTDEAGYKRFASRQTSIPSATPFMDVVYADEGATYSLPTGGFTSAVTAVSTGTVPVRVTNWGSSTWQSGSGFGLRVRVYDVDDKPYRASEGPFYATKDVAPGQYLTINATVAPLPPGKYKLYISMVDAQGRWFSDTPYNVPLGTARFNVVNLPPMIKGNSPAAGATIDTVQPTLWVQYNDADSAASNARYEYQICRGAADDKTNCKTSTTQTAAAWQIPAGFLTWGETAYWYARVYDGTTWSAWTPAIALTPQPAQPPVTSHLAGAADGSTVPGLNPQIGNFTDTVTDAQISAVGPALAAQRTYNSQDLRTSGAFGTGWSTPWDQRLTVESDATVLVVLESGRTVRFGKNPDGTYVSPLGESLELASTASGFRMRDASGAVREFNTAGQLVTIKDAFGRGQTLTYTSGKLTRATDDASGRYLTLEWTGTHVTAVVVPASQTGAAASRWTYTYTGDLLTKACSPLSALDCTTYTYEATSFYEAAVQDANPRAYYSFDEIALGANLINRAADEEHEYDATSTGLLHTPVGGALDASDGRALDLGGNPVSAGQLPDKTLTGNATIGVELWFRAEPGERGIIFSLQKADAEAAYAGCAIPALYVGTDGLLHSGLWMSSGTSKLEELASTAAVNNGQWHHVVLTTGVTQQTLYLDGTAVDSASGRSLDQATCTKPVLGSGWGATAWAGMPTTAGYDPYRGELDDFSLYTRTLTAEEISYRFNAGKTATSRMTGAVNGQGHQVWSIDYDSTTGRVDSVTDVNSARWDLSETSLVDTSRLVTLASSFGKSETYTYDAAHNGRITTRSDAIGAETWTYNDAGFVSAHQDEVGLVTEYTTDDKGRRTAVKTCRAEGDCYTEYTAFYAATDPFDLRNGRVTAQSHGRSASATDTTYQTLYTYNDKGQPLTTAYPGIEGSTVNPNGTSSITYTTGSETAVGGGTVPAGLTATVTNEAGAVTTHLYTKAGDLAETVAPAGQVTRYTYDLLGRLTTTQVGSYTSGQFTARDTVVETLDAVGHTLTRTGTAFTNPVTGLTHRLQQTYTYDQYGQLDSTSSWDEAAPTQVRTTAYDYDAAGRPIATHYPDGSTQIQRWNSAGLLSGETTETGLELAYAYDERGRLLTTSAVGPDVDPTDPTATELLLEYRTYYDNDWAASTTDTLGRKTSSEYWGDGTVKRDLHTAPDGTETVTAQYEYDKARNLTKTTNAVGTVTQATYNARNWTTSTTVDPTGINGRTEYAYDKTGRTTTLVHKYAGVEYQTERIRYNTVGAVTKTFSYAPAVEGECHTVETYTCMVTNTVNTYNGEGLLASAKTGTDAAETYTYNSLGQVETTTGAARDVWVNGANEGTQSPVTTYGYNAFGELTHLEDATGNITETVYDTSGQPVRTILPSDTVAGSDVPVQPQITTAYRPGGLVETETDPRGATTTYTYDRYGRALAVTSPDPDGSGEQTAPVTSYTYDRAGQLLETTDPNGALTTATYDSFGRTATVSATERTDTDPAYFTTSRTYDNAGQLLTETTPSGATTAYSYDALGRAKTVTDAAGVVTAVTYPTATSSVATFADGGDGTARRQTTITDVLGNPVKNTSETNTGSGWTTVQCAQTRYDLTGRPIAQNTVQHATCATPDTTYNYDAAGQLTAITGTVSDTSAITVALGYDQLGHQTRMVDGNGNTTVYGFNDWGLQNKTVEPATTTAPDLAARTWTTEYDLAGNAVEQHLPGGVTQTAEYDLLGRKTIESGTGAEASTTIKHYTWDGVGNLTGFSSDLGDTTVDYNDRGLITDIAGNQTSAYAYNADSQVIERTDAAGTTAFTYDKGRLNTLTDPLTDTTNTYQWRGDGQLASITAGAVTRSFTYDGYGQLASDTVTASGQTKSIAYDYDGQLLTAKTTTGLPNAGTQTYGYDQQARLTSWTDTTGIETTYAWDANSNRVAVNRWDTECGEQAATTRLYVYDERNQLTEAMDGPVQCVQSGETWQPQTTVPTADETWTYTARGTTATHQDAESTTTNYAFDAFEQLKTALVDGNSVANQYDALGRLVARNGNTNFAYDGLTNNLTASPNGASGIDRIVRDPAGGTVSQTQGGITGLAWTAYHGDLTAIINPTTADLIAGGGFDPFGNPLPDTTDTTIGFQGGYTDPTTGDINAHARWYNPGTGTFTSRDTWQLAPSPIAQVNRYLYGNASPLGYSDPSGHWGLRDVRNGLLAVPYAAASVAYGTGVGINECIHGRCDNYGQAAYDASNEAFGYLMYGEKHARGGSTHGTRHGHMHSGRVPASGRGWNGGTGRPIPRPGDDSDDDFYFPDTWSPWVPLVPIVVIDWTALNTLPVGTALAAAATLTAIDLLDGLLMNNNDKDTDQNQKQIDLINDTMEGNQGLQTALENAKLLAAGDDGSIVGIDWRDHEDCDERRWQKNGSTYRHKLGSDSTTRGGTRATFGVAYLCGELGNGKTPYGAKPWNWPKDHKIVNNQMQYARCHLIGAQLGGSGALANLVTCLQDTANRQAMLNFEDTIRDAAKTTDIIYIAVPIYNGSNSNGNDGYKALTAIELLAISEDGRYWQACIHNNSYVLPYRGEC
jgi:RHS repeat-associated protein